MLRPQKVTNPTQNRPKLTDAQKFRQLRAHTEDAGMVVQEINGKIVVTRKGR